MKVKAKINVELSLREARAVARAVAMASRIVYDGRAPFGCENQSEVYRALNDAESQLSSALGAFASEAFGSDGICGYYIRHRWGDEPIAAPFSRSVARRSA